MKRLAIVSTLLSAFAFFAGGVSHAQTASVVMPDSGMWSFPAEQTGKPGRGFQLDTQGETQ